MTAEFRQNVDRSEDGSLHFWPFEDEGNAESARQGEATTRPLLDSSPIRDHKDAVNCIAISRGSQTCAATLATSSEDCSIQVYSVGQL